MNLWNFEELKAHISFWEVAKILAIHMKIFKRVTLSFFSVAKALLALGF